MQESPLHQRWARLEERLDRRLDALVPIRENRTCWIYRARAAGEDLVVKQYKHHARQLCAREAQALRLYSELCRGLDQLLPSELRALNERTGTLSTTFIEGELMSSALRRCWWSRRERSRCRYALQRVSELLQRFWERTRSECAPSSFLEKYLVHTSEQLEGMPIYGALFDGYVRSARQLYQDLKEAGDRTSLSHGDLVCANLVLCGDRVGVIDFANANPESHPLDDVYNMQVTLENLFHLPVSLRRELCAAISSGLNIGSTDPRTRTFYWEYHKRRWLHLQLSGGWARRARTLAILPLVMSSSPTHEPAPMIA